MANDPGSASAVVDEERRREIPATASRAEADVVFPSVSYMTFLRLTCLLPLEFLESQKSHVTHGGKDDVGFCSGCRRWNLSPSLFVDYCRGTSRIIRHRTCVRCREKRQQKRLPLERRDWGNCWACGRQRVSSSNFCAKCDKDRREESERGEKKKRKLEAGSQTCDSEMTLNEGIRDWMCSCGSSTGSGCGLCAGLSQDFEIGEFVLLVSGSA